LEDLAAGDKIFVRRDPGRTVLEMEAVLFALRRHLPAAFRSESAALSFIRNRVARETKIMVGESSAWNDLSLRTA
jgi:hypothetical protein